MPEYVVERFVDMLEKGIMGGRGMHYDFYPNNVVLYVC